MSKALPIIVTIQGGVLTVSGARPKTVGKALVAKEPSGTEHAKGGSKKQQEGTLSRRIRRSKINFAQTVGTIRNKPTEVLSMVTPKHLPNEYAAIILGNYLKRFFKQATELYPKAYFIYCYGYSDCGGLHAHVLMRFGGKGSRQERRTELCRIWGNITGSYEPHLLQMDKNKDDWGISYLTSPKKDDEWRMVARKLADHHIWDIIKRKNIRWEEKFEIPMAPDEYEVFLRMLEKLLVKADDLPESTWEQLNKYDYCLNHLPPKLLLRAYKKFKKWRAAQ